MTLTEIQKKYSLEELQRLFTTREADDLFEEFGREWFKSHDRWTSDKATAEWFIWRGYEALTFSKYLDA